VSAISGFRSRSPRGTTSASPQQRRGTSTFDSRSSPRPVGSARSSPPAASTCAV
ncbi:MAG: hypothetical protein AVDCRST_MAG19-3060, partial [uncultured Thermomicrobiales bacterium]